jgi:hypothetical protein
MKTPITDAALKKWACGGASREPIVPAMRRLELDRAALMEALEASERISQAIRRGEPMMESRFDTMVDEFETKRESALATARANFPTE